MILSSKDPKHLRQLLSLFINEVETKGVMVQRAEILNKEDIEKLFAKLYKGV